MAPFLAKTIPFLLNHWWTQVKFRHQHKKGWNETLDETFLIYAKNINESPLFEAAKNNSVGCIQKLLNSPSTNVFERGPLGETALHIAVINENLDAAVALIEKVPDLINEPMTSEFFQGLTPLHIAVINQNINLVHQLISHGGDVSTPRASGLYFRKRKGGLLYCGEHILSFAVCTGNKDIITMLIDNGASTRVQDYRGNTVLHILVLQSNKATACQTMDLIMTRDEELDHSVTLDMVPNSRGFTPLKLAARYGNIKVFQHLVHKRRVLHWSLDPLTSYLYDLTEIDSWADNQSVLEAVATSSRKEARAILDQTPVKQLIKLKWHMRGKHYFRLLMVVHIMYVLIFTLVCLFRPLKGAGRNITANNPDKTILVQKTLSESYVTASDWLRLVGEIITLIGVIVILVVQIPTLVKQGLRRYVGQTALGGPFHILIIAYAFMVLLLLVCRVAQYRREAEVMSLCLVLVWCSVMFFGRGFELFGPYVIVLQKAIFEDMVKYLFLMAIFIMAFASAIWMVYMTQDPNALLPYWTYGDTLFSEFELCLGLVNLPIDQTIYTPPIVGVTNFFLTVTAYVLMLNMVIAMVGDTNWRVSEEKNEVWRIQVVATILMMERRMPRSLWPRIGICGLTYGLKDRWYLRVEERNNPLIQKIQSCVKNFSQEDENDAEGQEQSDAAKGSSMFLPKDKEGSKQKEASGCGMTGHTALGLERKQNDSKNKKERTVYA